MSSRGQVSVANQTATRAGEMELLQRMLWGLALALALALEIV